MDMLLSAREELLANLTHQDGTLRLPVSHAASPCDGSNAVSLKFK